MAKYVNEKWGDKKYYYLAPNIHGTFTLKEFNKGAKVTELKMVEEQAQTFIERMKDNGWYEV